jgi:SurA N-terminal domain
VTRLRLRFPRGRVFPLAALALSAGAALGSAGCQPVQAGAALVVDGDRVSVSEIQSRVTEVIEQREQAGAPAQEAGTITQEQVRRMIVARILQRAAAETKVSVNQAEVDAQRRQLEQQAGGADAFGKQVAGANIAPGDLNGFLRDLLLGQKIGEAVVPNVQSPEQQQERAQKTDELVGRIAREMRVVVNPRYGQWNPERFSIEPVDLGFVEPDKPQTPGAPGEPGQQPPQQEGQQPPPQEGQQPPPQEGQQPPPQQAPPPQDGQQAPPQQAPQQQAPPQQ